MKMPWGVTVTSQLNNKHTTENQHFSWK